MRLYTTFGSAEFQKAYQKMEYLEFEDYADFKKRYATSLTEIWADMSIMGILFEGIGVLYNRKLISLDLVNDLFGFPIRQMWEKYKPIIEGEREATKTPGIAEYFEYIYDELMKERGRGNLRTGETRPQ